MALTNREKQARFRERLKKNPSLHEKFTEKDRKRKSLERQVLKRSTEKWKEYRAKENKRLREFHTQKNAGGHRAGEESPSGFRSRQSLGKAVKKAKQALPKSPRKRKAVTAVLAEESGIVAKSVISPGKMNRGISDETKQQVVDFYLSDEISWQAPGLKDHTIICTKDDKGVKQKTYVQSRYMLTSLSEAYQILCQETDIEISRSKFCDLRPKNVKLYEAI
ncbi:uncharacterized protein LOC132874927 [Neoarius graeffei]|uniref:uncharacterized protein LOC132874927 n=1 Tax=Neoarius graeffei TaxID=443677 RepID=UPI00298BFCEA|nr:uncharacterized protein LOC132874927 [Neoarius graeffei]